MVYWMLDDRGWVLINSCGVESLGIRKILNSGINGFL